MRATRLLGLFAVVTSLGCVAGGGVGGAPQELSLYGGGSTPTNVDVGNGSAVELGMQFTVDTAGTADAVRFYKGPGDTGVHVGHLWTASGTVLAEVTFSGETASGWQQMAFSTPVALTPGTTYVVSYHTSTGFPYDPNYFDTPRDASPIHAPAGAGVYTFGPSGSFPTSTYLNSSYWVDIDFTPSSSTAHLFAPSDVPGQGVPSSYSYELGVRFQSDVSGTIAGVRYYRQPGDVSAHVAHVWDASGSLLATATFTGETASGWQEQAVSVSASAGVTYTVSYSTSSDFSYDASFYSSPRDRAPLHAPIGAGVYGAAGTFPTSTYADANYWVDLSFTAGGACVPSCTSCGGSDGCGGSCCTGTSYSIWTTQSAESAAIQSVDYELGTTFSSELAGDVTALRFYRAAGDTGPHVGRLWTAGGSLLASAPFTGTSAGWDQVTLSTPVSIAAGTTYVVSYDATTGFAYTLGYFGGPRDVAPLHVPANGGVYASSAGTFPSATYNASSYWADVVLSPGTPSQNETLFTTGSVPANPLVGEGTEYELGVHFSSSVAGNATAIRFYKGAGNTGTHTGHLWDTSGTLLATVTFTGETASGWQEAALSPPVALASGTDYVVSFNTVGGFSYDEFFFSTPYTRGPLTVPAGGSVYTIGSSFPTSSYHDINYWVDVVLTH